MSVSWMQQRASSSALGRGASIEAMSHACPLATGARPRRVYAAQRRRASRVQVKRVRAAAGGDEPTPTVSMPIEEALKARVFL